MIKIHCHDQLSVRYPPINGPARGENIAATPNNPIATPLCSGGNISSSTAWHRGNIAPLPIPCTILAAISACKLGASTQRRHPSANNHIL